MFVHGQWGGWGINPLETSLMTDNIVGIKLNWKTRKDASNLLYNLKPLTHDSFVSILYQCNK